MKRGRFVGVAALLVAAVVGGLASAPAAVTAEPRFTG